MRRLMRLISQLQVRSPIPRSVMSSGTVSRNKFATLQQAAMPALKYEALAVIAEFATRDGCLYSITAQRHHTFEFRRNAVLVYACHLRHLPHFSDTSRGYSGRIPSASTRGKTRFNTTKRTSDAARRTKQSIKLAGPGLNLLNISVDSAAK